ncbi:MAG: hypothetical protein ABIU06_17260 [Anaerolineales bacterium]
MKLSLFKSDFPYGAMAAKSNMFAHHQPWLSPGGPWDSLCNYGLDKISTLTLVALYVILQLPVGICQRHKDFQVLNMHLPSASICFLEAVQYKMNCDQIYMQGGPFV